jgi:nucleotide-binding universal stress UspA family protein
LHNVIEGDAAHAIVSYAREDGSDLIVMSTHGYGPFRRLLLGSVTAKVLNDAHCPVWTGPHLEAAPGIPEIQFRRILCAIDLATGSPAVLEWAEEFARAYGAGLAVVHILPESFIQLGGIYFDPEWRRQVEGTARERLQQLREARGSKAELLVEFGEVPASVAALARRWAADLLVIGRGSESGMVGRLRANTYAIIRESPCPVVAV